jgi:hypothetical protein
MPSLCKKRSDPLAAPTDTGQKRVCDKKLQTRITQQTSIVDRRPGSPAWRGQHAYVITGCYRRMYLRRVCSNENSTDA